MNNNETDKLKEQARMNENKRLEGRRTIEEGAEEGENWERKKLRRKELKMKELSCRLNCHSMKTKEKDLRRGPGWKCKRFHDTQTIQSEMANRVIRSLTWTVNRMYFDW